MDSAVTKSQAMEQERQREPDKSIGWWVTAWLSLGLAFQAGIPCAMVPPQALPKRQASSHHNLTQQELGPWLSQGTET